MTSKQKADKKCCINESSTYSIEVLHKHTYFISSICNTINYS